MRALFVQPENVFYLYLCIWIAYAECQWLDGLSSPSEFISSIKLSNYLFMSCGEDMYACDWKHTQQCHLAILRKGVGGIFFISSSLCLCFSFAQAVSFFYSNEKFCPISVFCILLLSVLENALFVIHTVFLLLMIRMIEIIYSLHKTGNQNTPLRNSSKIPTWHIICIPCQWCNIIPHCEQVSNFSLCESASEQGSYSLPDNCQNNSR